MSNDVKIRVTSSAPDLKTTRDSVRSSYASMGQQAGKDFASNLENAVKDRATQVGDTAGKNFNTGLSRSSKGGAKDVGKDFADSLKSGIKGDVVAVGKELGTEFADAFNSSTKHAGKGFAERVYLNARAGLRPVGEELGREFSDSFDGKASGAGKKTGTSVGKNVAENLKQQTSATMPLIALGIEAALGPAGGVAGAAIAGTFAVGLGALGVVAAAKTKVVQDEFHNLTATTANAWQQWGEDLKNPVANSVDYIRRQFIHLAPDIEGDLKAVGPGIQIVTSGLGLLATNTIPGLNAAAHQMGPVWMGIRALLGDVGSSIGGLAQTSADHSASIGTDFKHVGDVVQGLVTFVGHLVGELADDFAQHGGELTGAVHAIDSAVTGLGTGAFPVLGNAVGADLQVIKGFFDVVGMGGAPLGALAGGLLSAATNAKLLGLAQGPLEGLSKKLRDAGDEGTTYAAATSKAAGWVDKFGKALPLVGVALTGVSLIMEAFTQHERDAVAAGEEVAKGLEMGGGAAVNARAQIATWQKQVTDGQQALKELSNSQGDYNTVLEAGSTGLSANGLGQANANQQINDANTSIKTALDSYNKYAVAVGLAGMTLNEFSGQVKTYDSSAQNATSNTAQLAADMLVLKDNTASADSKAKALQDTLALLSDQGLQKADDAMDQFGNTLSSFSDGLSKMKGNVFDSSGQLNSFSDAGRTVRKTIEDARDSMVTYAQAAADAGVPQDQINAKLGDMANQLENTIGPAVGSKGAADDLLRTYKAMPDNITTYLHADTSNAQAVINSFIQMNNGRQIQIYTSILGSGGVASAGRLATGGLVGQAASGRTVGGGMTWMGENGPEKASYMGRSAIVAAPSLVQAPIGTQVSSAADTARRLAEATQSGGGSVDVRLEWVGGNTEVGQFMAMMLKKYIRVTGGGDVQVALGGA